MSKPLYWSNVNPGDWIKAQSVEKGASQVGAPIIQGVVESVHDHGEYGLVVSVNDTRRAVVNWKLLERREAQ